MEKDLLGIFLEAEEFEEEVSMILDSDIAYDLATQLEDDLGKEFFTEGTYHYDFEYLKDNYDILTLALIFEDGKPLYFLEETLSDNGEITLYSESDTFYIQEELMDIIDIDRLDGDIYTMEISEYEYDSDEDFDEVDDELEDMLQETLKDIDESECQCSECVYDKLMDLLSSVYDLGYDDGFEDAEE